MNITEPAALATARAYHRAWTGHDLDGAMRYIADDITCRTPGGRVVGAAAYRAFLDGFLRHLTGIENVAAFGDEATAVLVYYPRTAVTTDAPTAEHFTVSDNKITSSILIFDRLSFAPPQP